MSRYDTDLWIFLKENDERSLGISDRLQLAAQFFEEIEEIKASKVTHRDLKPSNVLLNLTEDRKWNGQMEIADFGIATFEGGSWKNAGTSGWAEASQFTFGDYNDDFAARLVIFMILLSWNMAWSFIWNETTTVNLADPIEKIFLECRNWDGIPKLLSKIRSQIRSPNFCNEWAQYCRSPTANFNVNSNTQRSVNVEVLFSQMHMYEQAYITDGTRLHHQDFSNICHSFAIITSLRKELGNVMDGQKTTVEYFKDKTSLEVLDERYRCSFSNLLLHYVTQVSPRSLHGLSGRDSNQQEISAQFADLEKGIRRLVYRTKAFEEQGWKRMPGVAWFFHFFGLFDSFRANFELSYFQVGHPNSATNAQFYPTAISLGIIPSSPQIPTTTFDIALDQKHYVIVWGFSEYFKP